MRSKIGVAEQNLINAWVSAVEQAETACADALRGGKALPLNAADLAALANRNASLFITREDSRAYHQRLFDARLRSAALVKAFAVAPDEASAFCESWAANTSTTQQPRVLALLEQLRNPRKARGVSFDKRTGKWRAQITLKGTRVSLGRFDTETAARQAVFDYRDKHATKPTKYIGIAPHGRLPGWCLEISDTDEERFMWWINRVEDKLVGKRPDGFDDSPDIVLETGESGFQLGRYSTARSAAEAHDHFVREAHDNPRLNFPRFGELDRDGNLSVPPAYMTAYERALALFELLGDPDTPYDLFGACFDVSLHEPYWLRHKYPEQVDKVGGVSRYCRSSEWHEALSTGGLERESLATYITNDTKGHWFSFTDVRDQEIFVGKDAAFALQRYRWLKWSRPNAEQHCEYLSDYLAELEQRLAAAEITGWDRWEGDVKNVRRHYELVAEWVRAQIPAIKPYLARWENGGGVYYTAYSDNTGYVRYLALEDAVFAAHYGYIPSTPVLHVGENKLDYSIGSLALA